MARQKIREYDAKRLIVDSLKTSINIKFQSILITERANLDSQEYPWLSHSLVVKPDQLFGKRKKLGLVKIDVSFEEAKQFIQQHMGTEITIGKVTGRLTHFLIEPFIPHEQEYYLAFTSERDFDSVHFSMMGGVEIEGNWESVKKMKVPTLSGINEAELHQLTDNPAIIKLIKELYETFRELNFSYLELNPFTVKDGQVYLLDTVAQVDSCASFLDKWSNLEFPKEYGKNPFAQEELIREIDKNSGASLKFTILNPKGKIWSILGGGGASIIYLDMITNLGKGTDIANYGESSGNPSAEESYQYAKAILEMMIENQGEILFIVGGIANFTDVRKTFTGFIKALEEYANKLKENNVTVFIRRGGPNYEAGLKLIKEKCDALNLQSHVHGPETSMPDIIRIAGDRMLK